MKSDEVNSLPFKDGSIAETILPADFEEPASELTQAFLDHLAEAGRLQPRTEGQERRRDARILADELASLTRSNPLYVDRQEIRIINISKRGLKLSIPEPLEIGSIVRLRLKDVIVTVEVRYCLSAGERFHTGVVIQDVFPRPRSAPAQVQSLCRFDKGITFKLWVLVHRVYFSRWAEETP